MVMIIMHIAYIICLVTDDGRHSCDVIVVYNIHLRAGGISYFAEPAILRMAETVMGEIGSRILNGASKYCGWLARLWERSGPLTFNGASKTVVA